jgi:peptidoglycan/xylan/chitin deacetylase (PgdA/CDA1 family)
MKHLLALIVLLLSTVAAAVDPPFAWPHGQHAAIVLTYDDAVPSDLAIVIPQLDRAGLKGTFFLMGKAMHAEDLPRWRAAAASGHELANHTINHPCNRGTYDMPPQYNSESYSVDTLLSEINVMNILLTAIDGQPKHAFGTPCAQTKVGVGSDKDVDKEAERKDYIGPLKASGLASYIRDPAIPIVNGKTDSKTSSATSSPVPKFSDTAFVGSSGAEMIAWVKEVEKSEGVGVIVFHGVGGDYLSVSSEAHQQLLDYLAAHRAEIWTAPYTETMDYVVKRAR